MFYIVGVTDTCKRLAVVGSLAQAEAYIGTLPACAHGIYYIDGPLGSVVQLAEPTVDDLPAAKYSQGDKPMTDPTDPHGSLNPDWHPNTSRFTLHVQPEEPAEEHGWRFKITVVDRKYRDSDSYPIESIASGNNWQEAFSSAAHMVETALASQGCVF